MQIIYKRIENKYDKYFSYQKALSWDTKNTYSREKEITGIDWLIQKMIGVYHEEELIALGCIKTEYDLDKKMKYAYLSSIVDFRFRRCGIANNLLKEMLIYCKELNVEKVIVNILKENSASISQIEKNDFNFVKFDDEIITFEKKLINK